MDQIAHLLEGLGVFLTGIAALIGALREPRK